jgi:hypothetical protein
MGLEYVPLYKSNEVYKYQSGRKLMQEKLGDNYYVPQLYFFKFLPENRIVTVSTWTQSIPNVFPIADFYFLVRKVKKLFRSVNETVVIKAESLNQQFGQLLKPYDLGCKIIHPEDAAKAKKFFNSIRQDVESNSFVGLPIERLTNAKP